MKHDPLVMFVLRLFDPEDFGWAVPKEVRDAAKQALIERLETETKQGEIQ